MRSRRALATVLFTDIVGSTERASELGDRACREQDPRFRERMERLGLPPPEAERVAWKP